MSDCSLKLCASLEGDGSRSCDLDLVSSTGVDAGTRFAMSLLEGTEPDDLHVATFYSGSDGVEDGIDGCFSVGAGVSELTLYGVD